jgi:lycopene cyclase domain-containing protein
MTYLGLAVPFLAAGAVLAAAAARFARPPARFWVATLVAGLVLLVLTTVFDSLMIAGDLFRYRESALLGVRVLRTPVEDLAWPVCAVLALPALWELLPPAPGRVRRER